MKKLIAIILMLGWNAVWAVPVQWTLTGVELEEVEVDIPTGLPTGEIYYGASVTGSFVYDADTNVYSDVNIVTDPGQNLFLYGGTTYDGHTGDVWWPEDEVISSDGVIFRSGTSCGGFCQISLSLAFASSLTNSGGVIALDTYPASYEEFNGDQYAFVDKRRIISGSVTGTVVPVPAAVWLFGSGLGLLGWMRRRQAA